MVIMANKNVKGTAVPAMLAAREPFSAIAAVGAIIATEIAMASTYDRSLR